MGKYILATFCLSIALGTAQGQAGADVSVGTVDSLHSGVLKEERKCWVHLPPSALDSQHPKKRYPVIYVLDGDRLFSNVVGMTDLLGTMMGNTVVPEVIVVGILNTDRFRDFTPTRVASGLWVDSTQGKRSGGGEAFTAYLQTELMPHIDSLYPAGRCRMLIGHSLGGLLAIHLLVHHPGLFNSYIAIEPSMWWDKQRLLGETANLVQNRSATGSYTRSFNGTALFLGMAHTQEPGMDTTMVQADRTDGTLHPRGVLELSRYILSLRQNGLESDFRYYDAETHGTIPVMAIYDGLHFLYKDYPMVITDASMNDAAFPMADFLKEHFETLTSKYGITRDDGSAPLPPEDLVNRQGNYAMSRKAYDKAEALFRMNIQNYPASYKTYGLLGDLCAARGDTAAAIKNYKMSLSMRETEEVKKKLEKVEKK